MYIFYYSKHVEIQITNLPPPLIDFNNMNITFYSFHLRMKRTLQFYLIGG